MERSFFSSERKKERREIDRERERISSWGCSVFVIRVPWWKDSLNGTNRKTKGNIGRGIDFRWIGAVTASDGETTGRVRAKQERKAKSGRVGCLGNYIEEGKSRMRSKRKNGGRKLERRSFARVSTFFLLFPSNARNFITNLSSPS